MRGTQVQREDSKMNLYHHPTRGNQEESWTLVLSVEESRAIEGKFYGQLSWYWHQVVNFFGNDVMYYTTAKDKAESFATNHGLQIEEGT